MNLEVTVNGATVEAEVEPRLLLCDFIRHHLKLTRTHAGREMGACDACTAILDGEPTRSHLTFAPARSRARRLRPGRENRPRRSDARLIAASRPLTG